MVTIKIRFFGESGDLAATSGTVMTLSGKASVSYVMDIIFKEYPTLRMLAGRLLTAVNEDYATSETLLSDGDTLAIFPPVSGGADEDFFLLTREPIDMPGLIKRLLQNQDGAVVVFEGVVRDHSMGKAVLYLEYEAYEPMALKMIETIGREVHEKWPIDRVGMIHRLGRMEIGETSVAIVVTSAHRRPAFEACHYAIDRLKKIVPIWKREYFADGAVWVEGEGCSHDELPRKK
ncbi:MAG: molybdenum cofactor biosynthesis protein MoaE [Acidobacteria bacterium]|nr:molybdenum cofactor biosynthesis protein MoaE [Acidobacteriota bacterium]